MAKHQGITIRIGASHDQVEVRNGDSFTVYDRSAMRKSGNANLQGGLRRAVVEAWEENRGRKDKRNDRRSRGQAKDKARRDAR